MTKDVYMCPICGNPLAQEPMKPHWYEVWKKARDSIENLAYPIELRCDKDKIAVTIRKLQ